VVKEVDNRRARQKPIGLLVILATFVGAGLLGMRLAALLAPASGLASAVSTLMLPLGVFLGLVAWLGAALLLLLPSAIRALLALLRGKRERTGQRAALDPLEVPPGSVVFVPTCTLCGASAGVIVGLVSPHWGFFSVVGLYLVLGLLFGILCWRLARAGYIPFPEPE
jgi:hypothetical protein